MSDTTHIVQREDPILRKKAQPISLEDISSPRVQKLITTMKETLAGEKDGVALAGPQIGASVRIFVIAPNATFRGGETDESTPPLDKTVYINPEIVRLSKTKTWTEEGCLSVRWLYGKVKRADKARVRAFDEYGKPFERGASGILAQIFQHEIGHLNGELFLDIAKDLEELSEEAATHLQNRASTSHEKS